MPLLVLICKKKKILIGSVQKLLVLKTTQYNMIGMYLCEIQALNVCHIKYKLTKMGCGKDPLWFIAKGYKIYIFFLSLQSFASFA